MTLRTTQYKLVQMSPATHTGKYTLVDFWFTHCPACIAQFPKLKQCYALHHINGFEIVAISTDGKNNFQRWQKMVSDEGMGWKHYLDLNGVHAQELSITTFPTNYLLDERGIVLKRNITPTELETFLVERGL